MISLCIEKGTTAVLRIFLPLLLAFLLTGLEPSSSPSPGLWPSFGAFLDFFPDFLDESFLFFFFTTLKGFVTGLVVTLGSSIMKS
jgi:hypothetical protein